MTDSAALPTLGVTGSSGSLGGDVARLLAVRGIPMRLLVRDPARAPGLPEAVPVRCAYADDADTAAALAGVRILFMVSMPESAERLHQHCAFVDAAESAGVGHIVYTSFFGAGPESVFTLARDHFATEQHIRASGIPHTFLRDNLYLDFLPKLAGPDGVIRGPAGRGRVAAVASEDVARCAAAVLAEPEGHLGATYELTGPAALTLDEVAEIITRETGRPVRFHDETVDEAYLSRQQWPAPQWQYDAWVSTYLAIAAGELDGPTGEVARLTGRAPLDLAALLRGRVG